MTLPAFVEADTLVGRMVLPRDDAVVTPAIQQDGYWEPGESAALAALIAPGATVVEIGAHVGYLTALMSRAAGPEGRVVAVEAHPDNHALLAENVGRLGLTNVTAVHGAAWRTAGLLDLAVSPDNSGDHRAYGHQGSTAAVTVPSVRIDDIVDPSEPVHVAKVDAQGVDHIALEGMARTIERWRPVILIEFWPPGIAELGDDPAAVVAGYRSLGYDISVMERPGLGPAATDAEIVAAAWDCPGEYCSLLLHPARAAPARPAPSPVLEARDALARGPIAPPHVSPGGPRDYARRALLRTLKPFTAYERQIDENLVEGLADTQSRLAALEREVAERAAAQPAPTAAVDVPPADAGYTLSIEYPPNAVNEPRWGWGKAPHPQLVELLRANHDAFSDALEEIAGHVEAMTAIPITSRDVLDATWLNGSLPALDGAAIYGFLRERKPRRYLEVGSGNSTKFAARAKADGNLDTELISIDPSPWTAVDPLCDTIVRTPFETTDRAVLEQIEPGDVVFFDASHRAFMNGDTVTFFLEALPALPSGVLVAVHDVFLPDDYPLEWADRWYNEQYLLACWLLAGGDRIRPVLASYYVSLHTELDQVLQRLWDVSGFEQVPRHGGAFWFSTGGGR